MGVLHAAQEPYLKPAGVSGSLMDALESLMWVVNVNYDPLFTRWQLRGYLKPPEDAATEGELIAGCEENFLEILDILDQGGMDLYRHDVTPQWTRDGLRVQVLLEVWNIT